MMKEVRALLNNVIDGDWWVRRENTRKLLDYPEDLYLADLEGWLRNGENALLRNTAMEIYRELGDRALGSLVYMLRDEDSDVRIFSANVLGDIKDSAALGSLINGLQDPDDNVRVAVAEALGKTADERAVAALSAVLGHTHWTTMAAIEALGNIGGQAALSALQGCLADEEYRGMVCAALERTGDRGSIEHLVPYLDREESWQQALQAIVGIAEREDIGLQAELFVGCIDQLTDWLSWPPDAQGRASFVALSWSEDMRALPFFLRALHDNMLVEYALKGLLSLGKQAVPEIIEALKKTGSNRVVLAKVLTMLGEEEMLIQFASDEDDEVRTEVALALGSLGTPEASEALQALSRDRSEEVRSAAKLSLRNSER